MNIQKVTVDDCLVLRHAVLWPDADIAQCRVEGDDEASHYGVINQDEMVSCLSVFFLESGTCQIRKFATSQRYQGKGYGTALMQSVLENLAGMGTQHVFLDARTSAISFYRKFGFISEGHPFLKNDIEYIRMNIPAFGISHV